MPFYDRESKSSQGPASDPIAAQLTAALFTYSFMRLSERSLLSELISESKMAQLGIIDESSTSKLGHVQSVIKNKAAKVFRGLEIKQTGLTSDEWESHSIEVQTAK